MGNTRPAQLTRPMRRRFSRVRPRPMARPTIRRLGRAALSPRARVLAGWVAALALVGLVAFLVGRVGGEVRGPGGAVGDSPSHAQPIPIAFGTALASDGSVDPASQTARFGAADNFAYSVGAEPPPGRIVYVEVASARDDPEPVQTPAPQTVPDDRTAIGFQVPAASLLEAFGPGTYEMRIYVSTTADPIAAGRFELVEASPSGG